MGHISTNRRCRSHAVLTFAVGVVVAAVFLAALSGCVSRSQGTVTNYYVLEFDESVGAASPEASLGGHVVVHDSEIAKLYDRRQLVQRLDGPLVRYRSTELWAVSPTTAVGNLVRQGLAESGLFEGVTQGRDARGRFEVTARIDELAYRCCTGPVSAEIAGGFTLKEAGAEILHHEFSRSEELPDTEARTFVEAVVDVLSAELARFIELIPGAVEEQ